MINQRPPCGVNLYLEYIMDNEIDVDALYDQVMSEQPSGWEPESNSDETLAEPGEGANTPEAENNSGEVQEYSQEFIEQLKAANIPIKWGDSEKVLPGEKVIQYAQQGYDYNVKNRQLKHEREQLEEQRQQWDLEQREWQQKVEEYSRYDEFLKNNPQVFQEIQERYNQYQSGQDPNAMFTMPNQMSPMVQQLQDQVKQLQERLAGEDAEKLKQIESQKEAKLDESISQYKDRYSSFDWDKTDEFGYNLEEQILNHAIDKGIKDFRAAANDYLFDEHLKVAQLNAKEQAGKSIQKQKKMGLGEVRSEPMRKMPEKSSSRPGNYNDAIYEIAQEYGIKDLM